MIDVYVPGVMSHLYQKLEKFVKDELNQEVGEEFRRKNPGAPKRELKWNAPGDRPLAREWLRLRDKLLSKKMNGHFLRVPRLVLQGQRPLCWAASWESWLALTANIRMTQEELRQKFAKDSSGALTIKSPVEEVVAKNELKEVFEHFGTVWQLLRPDRLTYRYLLENLRAHGHLLLLFNAGGMAHTVVAYAVFIDPGGPSKVKIMDPASGYLDYPLHELRQKNVVVAWKLRGRLLK
jgi:hypothetical protein